MIVSRGCPSWALHSPMVRVKHREGNQVTVQKAFEVEVKIDAAPDRVWAAVTDPTAIGRWPALPVKQKLPGERGPIQGGLAQDVASSPPRSLRRCNLI